MEGSEGMCGQGQLVAGARPCTGIPMTKPTPASILPCLPALRREPSLPLPHPSFITRCGPAMYWSQW